MSVTKTNYKKKMNKKRQKTERPSERPSERRRELRRIELRKREEKERKEIERKRKATERKRKATERKSKRKLKRLSVKIDVDKTSGNNLTNKPYNPRILTIEPINEITNQQVTSRRRENLKAATI